MVVDQLTLCVELFDIYKKYYPEAIFEKFYPWGSLALNDFDEIDKNLINAQSLFKRMSDIREIEQQFQLDADDLESFASFWETISGQEPEGLKKEFVNSWILLGKLYIDLQKTLESKKMCYAGMITRKIAANVDSWLSTSEVPTTIFAGFHALPLGEEKIIDAYIRTGKGKIYFDTDEVYVDDHSQEAGRYFRKSKLFIDGEHWKFKDFGSSPKTIYITAAPLNIGQSKLLGLDLAALGEKDLSFAQNSVLVLPDESLLFPVLSSIPDEVKALNVSMGYPLKNSSVFSFILQILELQLNAKNTVFYHKDVVSILNHTFVQTATAENIPALLRQIMKSNWVYIDKSQLVKEEEGLLSLLFSKVEKITLIIPWLKNVLNKYILYRSEIKDQDIDPEAEFAFMFYTLFTRLENIVETRLPDIDLKMLIRLLKEIAASASAPFRGEPLKGLQIMGFLETRVLDFKNVFIMSVNEEIIPEGKAKQSFIPYNIRKALRLPVAEDQDSVSAYHFYRLLQRAENVYLYYNSEVRNGRGGEMSRWILQIEYELKKKFPDQINIVRRSLSTPIVNHLPSAIAIKKDEAVMKVLSRYTSTEDAINKPFSASALSQYINCSLQFYFRYIARLDEEDEVEEEMTAASFGKIFHAAIAKIYTSGEVYSSEKILALKKDSALRIENAFKEEYAEINSLEGKNLLLKNVLIELLNRTLDMDAARAPFTLLTTEGDMKVNQKLVNNNSVVFFGRLDRVEQDQVGISILDYKTGSVTIKNSSIEEWFSKPEYKAMFQTAFYAYLLHKSDNYDAIRGGLIPLKNISNGVSWLKDGALIQQNEFEEFESRLTSLVSEILNPDISFSQTSDLKRCVYCPFIGICGR